MEEQWDEVAQGFWRFLIYKLKQLQFIRLLLSHNRTPFLLSSQVTIRFSIYINCLRVVEWVSELKSRGKGSNSNYELTYYRTGIWKPSKTKVIQ